MIMAEVFSIGDGYFDVSLNYKLNIIKERID